MSIDIHLRDGICELRLNAPPGNVIDRETAVALTAAVREHSHDPHLKAFLLTAAGAHFSYGASVPEHVAAQVDKFLPAFHDLFIALDDAAIPTIAAVQGLCLGGAFELVAFCDLILAEEDVRFAVPEIALGVFPPAACVFLPWKVGGAVAQDLILTGRRMDVEEGLRCGFVSRTCPAGSLHALTSRVLEESFRPRSAAALRQAVRASRHARCGNVRHELGRVERAYLGELMATHDANEGIAAFLEKREPVWSDS